MNPKISVIIPTYNRADLLPRAINSVLNQTFQDFELIIVDDGSTDNTKQVVQEFQNKDSRIKYIWQENSGGPAGPRNIGIRHSEGEYIAFLDSDDEWLLEKLEKQLKLFKNSKKKNLGFVGCNALIVNEKTGIKKKYNTPTYHNDEIFFKKLLENNFIYSVGSLMIRKEVFNNIGLYDESLTTGEDWDLILRIAQKYSFDFIPKSLFIHHFHSSASLTNNVSVVIWDKNLRRILEKHKEYYLAHPKVYSVQLIHNGIAYILLGNDLRKGRNAFLKSIKFNPLNVKSYVYFMVSLGGLGFCHKLVFLKRKYDPILFLLKKFLRF